MILLFTTKQVDLVIVLHYLFKPLSLFKIPINKMAHSIVLALNFIPLFIEQYNRVIKSQINKGIYYKKLKVMDRLEVLTSIITSMFYLAIKKSDLISDSMEIRFFDFNAINKLSFSIYYFDVYALLLHISLLCLVFKEVIFT